MLTKLPKPPIKIRDEALAHYRRAGKQLIEMGLLKDSDLDTLAKYASELAMYEFSMEKLFEGDMVLETPNGTMQISPYQKIAATALKNSDALAAVLGLQPKSRGQLKIGNSPAKKKDDPMADM